ncbi:MAG TPA: lytic transglycosylase domain-containing protein [Polyangiaceae bacterium]|nr:lytic transglycosylase domain-containing protein [Polyangiaceae bacterium]
MRSSAGPDAATEGQARARFVADLSACLEDWRRALESGLVPSDPRLRALRQLSQELERRAASVAFGGVGHHLRSLLALVDAGVLDPRALAQTLEVLRDMREQALMALSPGDRQLATAPKQQASSAGGAALPPPLITIMKPAGGPSGPPPIGNGPPPLMSGGLSGSNPGPPPLAPIPALPDFANQRLSPLPGDGGGAGLGLPGNSPQPPVLSPIGAQPDLFHGGSGAPLPLAPISGGLLGMGSSGANANFPSASGPPSNGPGPKPIVGAGLPPLGSAPVGGLPVTGGPPAGGPRILGSAGGAAGGGGFAPVPNAPAAAPGAQPNLLVRSMLGLRGFGRGKPGKPEGAPADAPPPPMNANASSPGILGLGARNKSRSSQSTPAVVAPPPLVADDPSGLPALHDLRPGSSSSPSSPPGGASPGAGSSAPPGLPGLPGLPGSRNRTTGRNLATGKNQTGKNEVLEKILLARDTGPRDARGPKRKRFQRRPDGADADRRVGLIAGIGLAVAVGSIFASIVLVQTCDKPPPPPPPRADAGVSADAGQVELPTGGLLSEAERRLYFMNKQIREHGEISPELRSLLDEEVALRREEIKLCGDRPCTAKDELAPNKARAVQPRKARTVVAGIAPKWLAGLALPSIPIEDDPRVESWFQKYTQSRELKEALQQSVFRCSQYREMVRTKFTRFELPTDLLAVAFWESECRWDAKSKAEAVGMWQFTKAAARAYHLLVIDNVVDERLNPAKATDAAIRYFSDMKKKVNSWDLVFAAYNMGPFGLMARIEQAGGGVSFFDLADAEMIPKETMNYAPAIQAIAVILNNLEALKFNDQKKMPVFTEGLEVPPNTRLTMVARAASTTVRALKELNRDLLADTTPSVEGFAVQVRPDVVWQAREELKKFITMRDDGDLCMPPETDWNVAQLTPAKRAECQKRREKATPER